jgi:hypothetical protein
MESERVIIGNKNVVLLIVKIGGIESYESSRTKSKQNISDTGLLKFLEKLPVHFAIYRLNRGSQEIAISLVFPIYWPWSITYPK